MKIDKDDIIELLRQDEILENNLPMSNIYWYNKKTNDIYIFVYIYMKQIKMVCLNQFIKHNQMK